MSTARKFKNITGSKMSQLKIHQLKKQTYNKMQWGVRAYNEWRETKLSNSAVFDIKVFDANLAKVKELKKEDFSHALCMFLAGVTKQKDGSD